MFPSFCNTPQKKISQTCKQATGYIVMLAIVLIKNNCRANTQPGNGIISDASLSIRLNFKFRNVAKLCNYKVPTVRVLTLYPAAVNAGQAASLGAGPARQLICMPYARKKSAGEAGGYLGWRSVAAATLHESRQNL
ncbi:hypothetical protein [Massilia suwonensis]|uniref:Uncharacterized protein n=1 Tax=Massilia suwonensis TaxID=648895 RepID=A0ABW0MFD6_9BURK